MSQELIVDDAQINIITIIATLINSWVSDSLPGSARWPGMLFASTMAIIFPVALAATPVHPPHIATRWVLYYLTALAGTCAGLSWTFVNETNRQDPEKRAYVSAMVSCLLSPGPLGSAQRAREADKSLPIQMNAFAYIFTAWVPIFTFPTQRQPYIVAGNYITGGFGAAAFVTVLAIRHFHNRDLKRSGARGSTSPGEDSEAAHEVDSQDAGSLKRAG